MKLVFLDTETTGLLKHPGAEVIEYAFAIWEDGKIIQGIDSARCIPKNGCPEEASRVNGYTREAWEASGAKPFGAEDIDNVCSYLTDGCLIAGSNPDFDRNMLEREFVRMGRSDRWPYISHRSLNLASIGFLLWAEGEVDGVGLDYLAHFFGIDTTGKEHTAAGDVETGIKVWDALHDHFMWQPRKMRSALKGIAENYGEDPELVKFCNQALEIEG